MMKKAAIGSLPWEAYFNFAGRKAGSLFRYRTEWRDTPLTHNGLETEKYEGIGAKPQVIFLEEAPIFGRGHLLNRRRT